MIRELHSYAELSPSRTGVHVLVRARLNGFPHHSTSKTAWGDKFEVYDRARYFTVTGHRLGESRIEDRQRELERVLEQVWPDVKATTPPATVAKAHELVSKAAEHLAARDSRLRLASYFSDPQSPKHGSPRLRPTAIRRPNDEPVGVDEALAAVVEATDPDRPAPVTRDQTTWPKARVAA